MQLKYYIPFLICLISLSGFGQSKFNAGLTIERGFTWGSEENDATDQYKGNYTAIGIPLRYQFTDRINLISTVKRSGRTVNYWKKKGFEPDIEVEKKSIRSLYSGWEILLGMEYIFVANKNLELIYTPSFNFTFFDKKDYYFAFYRTLDSVNYYLDLTHKHVDPFQISISNGVKIRLKNKWDFGLILNTGLNEIGSVRSDIFKLETKDDPMSQIPANFTDVPDFIYKNSYLTFAITYWPLRGEERKLRETEYDMDRKNALYIEAMGPMFYYSLNYDRILLSTAGKGMNFRIAGRVGANYMHLFDKDDINVLLGFSFLLGYKNHYLETGAGALRTFHETDESRGYFFIGYRKQKDLVFARAGMNLLVGNDSYDGYQFGWPSFGMGIAF